MPVGFLQQEHSEISDIPFARSNQHSDFHFCIQLHLQRAPIIYFIIISVRCAESPPACLLVFIKLAAPQHGCLKRCGRTCLQIGWASRKEKLKLYIFEGLDPRLRILQASIFSNDLHEFRSAGAYNGMIGPAIPLEPIVIFMFVQASVQTILSKNNQ